MRRQGKVEVVARPQAAQTSDVVETFRRLAEGAPSSAASTLRRIEKRAGSEAAQSLLDGLPADLAGRVREAIQALPDEPVDGAENYFEFDQI